MDFGVRPRDETPKSEVAHCKLSTSQESENGPIKNQIDFFYLFIYSQGIVHKEFVPPGQTANQSFIGKSLKDSGKGWHVCGQALHTLGCCTTTTPHVTRQYPFGREKHSCGSSASYSPDLCPCAFFLFPRLKIRLKGRHFGTLDNIQKSVTDELKGIPAEAFKHCYE